MAKTFYTDHDIEDMVKRGIMSLSLNDNIVLTDLAFEKAKRLGMSLVSPNAYTPPGAPIRPYISKNASPVPALNRVPPPASFTSPTSQAGAGYTNLLSQSPLSSNINPALGIAPLAVLPVEKANPLAGLPMQQSTPKLEPELLKLRIREAVISRLNHVDKALLDIIIERVLISTGLQ